MQSEKFIQRIIEIERLYIDKKIDATNKFILQILAVAEENSMDYQRYYDEVTNGKKTQS